ncbi:MAG TPA: cytochrome c oxidase subunit 3 [Bacteroidia bacterium]|jgi:cytochrome c oxidase subunit 3|nr:cytochrome c oxidase subunit 3 [Bacteroidia bacterium]
MPLRNQDEPEDLIFRKAEKNHPLKTMIWFMIAGITMLFVTLMFLFGINDPAAVLAGKTFPRPFIISTVIILASSFSIETAWRAFRRDNGKKLLDMLLITLGLALAFGVTQVWGWIQLWNSNITLFGVGVETISSKTPNGAFLYVISGLHIVHLLGGIIFLFLMMFKVVNVRSDTIRSVVFFSDKLERTRMEMLSKYWHFLGGLWLLLFLYFLWFFV